MHQRQHERYEKSLGCRRLPLYIRVQSGSTSCRFSLYMYRMLRLMCVCETRSKRYRTEKMPRRSGFARFCPKPRRHSDAVFLCIRTAISDCWRRCGCFRGTFGERRRIMLCVLSLPRHCSLPKNTREDMSDTRARERGSGDLGVLLAPSASR